MICRGFYFRFVAPARPTFFLFLAAFFRTRASGADPSRRCLLEGVGGAARGGFVGERILLYFYFRHGTGTEWGWMGRGRGARRFGEEQRRMCGVAPPRRFTI
jgi:hypothetical protein